MERYNFGLTYWRFDILRKISVIVKVEICLLRTTSGYKITPKVASVNTSKLYFRLRMIWSMNYEAPTSRIKSEAENRKPENWLLKHLTVSNVSGNFFSNRVNKSFSSCTWKSTCTWKLYCRAHRQMRVLVLNFGRGKQRALSY